MIRILKLKFRQNLRLEFGQYFAADDVEKRVDEFGSDLEAEVKFMLRL